MTNSSFLGRSAFLLTGIPGMESGNMWLAVPFCCTYVFSILGNSAILFVIKAEWSLHEPMCLCPCMLAIAELGVPLSMLLTVLSVLLFDSREVRFDACLAQMFFIHCVSVLDSGVLWAMAFDCFVDIYNPLQYASVLTNPRVRVIGLRLMVRSISLLLPLLILLKKPICLRTVFFIIALTIPPGMEIKPTGR